MSTNANSNQKLSLIKGIPLCEEEGIGALTLAGYLKEVTAQHGPREAAVLCSQSAVERWTYDDLWLRSVEVARALLACGAGKGTRVGILMTNRLEFLASVFGGHWVDSGLIWDRFKHMKVNLGPLWGHFVATLGI